MKLSQLLTTLQAALKDYGDVPVLLLDEELGREEPITEVLRLHPYNGPHGCLNRAEPVNALLISRLGGTATDLVLARRPTT